MRRFKRIIFTVTAFILLFSVYINAGIFQTRALDTIQDTQVLTLSVFLEETGITFGEYIDIVAQFEQEGVLTHYLDANALRYEAFLQDNPDIAESTAIAYVNVNVDFGPYNDIREIPQQELDSMTMLLNKNFALPENWEAGDMVDIGSGFMFREEAAGHLISMRDTMNENGLRFQLMSTYRPYAVSARLYNNAVSNYGAQTADLNWARGGHSEHQTALAADILHVYSEPLTNARFENTDEFIWLTENAHKYGFILRYPEEFEDIHGYKFEPWHWRYVGEEIATAMYNEKISVYEEFYGRYLASDTLHNVRRLLTEKREADEAAERERLEAIEREEAEKQAAEEARIAEEATREAEQARLAAEAAEREAQQHEEERLAEISKQEARKDMIFTYTVSGVLVLLIVITVIFMYMLMKRKNTEKENLRGK